MKIKLFITWITIITMYFSKSRIILIYINDIKVKLMIIKMFYYPFLQSQYGISLVMLPH